MATETEYRKELRALSTWIKQTAGLNSARLDTTPQKLARPVVIWETASRGSKTNLETYKYKQTVRQYGKLYAGNLDQLIEYQDKLIQDMENRFGVIPIVENSLTISKLREAEITFDNGASLEVAFNIKYEVTYGRTRPTPPPAPAVVTNTVTTSHGGYVKNEQ